MTKIGSFAVCTLNFIYKKEILSILFKEVAKFECNIFFSLCQYVKINPNVFDFDPFIQQQSLPWNNEFVFQAFFTKNI